MGKKLIIKGADFSSNKITGEQVFTTLYAYMGENDSLIEVPINQITSGKGAYIYVDRNTNKYGIAKSSTYAVGALIENDSYKNFKLKTKTGNRIASTITPGVLVFRDANENIIKAYVTLPSNASETDIYKDTTPNSNIVLEGEIPAGTVDIRAGYYGNSGSTFELTLYEDL